MAETEKQAAAGGAAHTEAAFSLLESAISATKQT